ncbi:uncharacterized protein LOC144922361 isoform X2 [Branchiostoma floridae x Branchiostoma belcheri]
MPEHPNGRSSKAHSLYPASTASQHSDPRHQRLSGWNRPPQAVSPSGSFSTGPASSVITASTDIRGTSSTQGSTDRVKPWKKDTHNIGNKTYQDSATPLMSWAWLAGRRQALEMAMIKYLANPEWVLPNRRVKHVDFVDPSGSFLHIHSKFSKLGINLLCPCGFHDHHGKKINLETNNTGHKITALYKDSSHSLQDGLVFLSHPLRTEDTIVLKIKRVDKRMSILYMCLTTTDPAMLSQMSLPTGCLSPSSKSPAWFESGVLQGLKPGDLLFIRLTDEGTLYCQRNNEEDRFILHVFDLSQHLWLGLCLSIGIRKVQLVGLIPREAPVPRTTAEHVHVGLGRKSSSCLCHMCNKRCGEKVVFTCGHVWLCPSCEAQLYCRMCRRAMCRSSCPVCTQTSPPQVGMPQPPV